mgnify:CR=1 FL=1
MKGYDRNTNLIAIDYAIPNRKIEIYNLRDIKYYSLKVHQRF